MPVVQITAPESVLYSLDGGFTLSEFEPGEFYSVPDYAATGMFKRGWAKLAESVPVEEKTKPEAEPVNEPEPPAEDRKSKRREK